MTVQAYIIITPIQNTTSVLLNDEDAALDPQEIANPLANSLGLGTLVGKFVVPARLLNDAAYARWVSSLGSLPISVFDTDTIFLPLEG